MKKQTIIILILLATLFSGCDDLEQTVDYQLPYIEKLVIQGQFGINSTNIAVSVTRTLPPLEQATLDKVTITDAECKVYYKDTVVDLVYANASNYVSEGRLDLEEGVEYRLEVKWKDNVAIAKTTIPRLPIIKSIKEVVFESDYGGIIELYWVFIEPLDQGMIRIDHEVSGFKEDFGLKLIDKVGKIDTVGFSREDYLYPNEVTPRTFIMGFYDIAYYPYYVTRDEGQSESGIFSGGGLNVEGNVEGDKAIGVWVGYNSVVDTVDKYIIE